jgi:hypothetical protein
MANIQRADPRIRRLALAIVVFGAAAGAALIAAFGHYRPELDAWMRRDPSASSIALAVVAALVCLPLFGAAAYLLLYGSRIVSAEMYPPPGRSLFRDTRVLTGPAAIRRGRLLQAIGGVILGACFVLLPALWRLWQLLPAGST